MSAVDAVVCAGFGYLFYHFDKKENYNLSRQTGHKLYLHFLLRGALYYFPSWVLAALLTDSNSLPNYFSFVVTFVLSLAFVGLHVFCRWITNPDANTLAIQAYKLSGDDLEYICAIAIQDESPIQVTLKNDKSYIGYIGRTIEPNKESPYLSIIPMGSGYRDNEGNLRITHWYTKIQDIIAEAGAESAKVPDLHKYLMAIPRSEIVTCHNFDFEIYQDIQTQLDPPNETTQL
jgi:hypothetical protein